MTNPDDAFPPASLTEELARNPEADAYFNDVVKRSKEWQRTPSWAHMREVLLSLGVRVGVTDNPIKTVYRRRGGWYS